MNYPQAFRWKRKDSSLHMEKKTKSRRKEKKKEN
jgi:hypothetical protein